MKTISKHVDEFMRSYPFLSKFLRQGIVNYKALARSIEPEISKSVGERVSVGAIAVSLQRLHYRDKNKLHPLIGTLRGVKVISNISVFSCSCIEIANSVFSHLLQKPLPEKPFFMMLSADNEVMIMIEKFLVHELDDFVQQKQLVISKDGLAALVVTREIQSPTEVGGLSYPIQVLAEHGIMVDAVSATVKEQVLFVHNKAADEAAEILRRTLWR